MINKARNYIPILYFLFIKRYQGIEKDKNNNNKYSESNNSKKKN